MNELRKRKRRRRMRRRRIRSIVGGKGVR